VVKSPFGALTRSESRLKTGESELTVIESVLTSCESVLISDESVLASRESVLTFGESVLTTGESVLTFFESVLTPFESVLTFCESRLTWFESVLKFDESVLMSFESVLIFFEYVLKLKNDRGAVGGSESPDFGRKRARIDEVVQRPASVIPDAIACGACGWGRGALRGRNERVVLAPDVAAMVPDSVAVNEALRTFVRMSARTVRAKPTPKKRGG
jgi:hypothetical protein